MCDFIREVVCDVIYDAICDVMRYDMWCICDAIRDVT